MIVPSAALPERTPFFGMNHSVRLGGHTRAARAKLWCWATK